MVYMIVHVHCVCLAFSRAHALLSKVIQRVCVWLQISHPHTHIHIHILILTFTTVITYGGWLIGPLARNRMLGHFMCPHEGIKMVCSGHSTASIAQPLLPAYKQNQLEMKHGWLRDGNDRRALARSPLIRVYALFTAAASDLLRRKNQPPNEINQSEQENHINIK